MPIIADLSSAGNFSENFHICGIAPAAGGLERWQGPPSRSHFLEEEVRQREAWLLPPGWEGWEHAPSGAFSRAS